MVKTSMKFNLFKKNQNFQIGLDICSSGIYAVLLGKNNKNFFLKNYCFEPFKEQTIQNGTVINPVHFIETLSQLINKNHFDTEMVNIAVQSNVAFIKTVSLPYLPIDELRIIAPQEAAKHIPFSINEVNLDYEIIDNSRKKNQKEKKSEIVIVALSKAIAKNYIDLINQTGLIVTTIDVAPFAMIRTLANADLIDNSDNLYISVLIGDENTDINIIQKGMPLFSHNAPTGKNNIMDLLKSSQEIETSETESILHEIVLPISGLTGQDHQSNRAINIVRTIYNNISAEIQKTIEFYNSQTAEQNEFKKIIIGGTGVCIQNIDKYIYNRFKIDTVLCNALNNIEHNFNIDNFIYPINIPAITTSVGLALKGLEN